MRKDQPAEDRNFDDPSFPLVVGLGAKVSTLIYLVTGDPCGQELEIQPHWQFTSAGPADLEYSVTRSCLALPVFFFSFHLLLTVQSLLTQQIASIDYLHLTRLLVIAKTLSLLLYIQSSNAFPEWVK